MSATQLQGFTDHICLQRIWETTMLMLLREINLDTGTTSTINRRLELFDFLKFTQVGFHLLDQRIHLFQGTSIR